MTKAEFYSVRTNNYIALILGLITVAYVVFVLSISVWSGKSEFIGMVAIGSAL